MSPSAEPSAATQAHKEAPQTTSPPSITLTPPPAHASTPAAYPADPSRCDSTRCGIVYHHSNEIYTADSPDLPLTITELKGFADKWNLRGNSIDNNLQQRYLDRFFAWHSRGVVNGPFESTAMSWAKEANWVEAEQRMVEKYGPREGWIGRVRAMGR